MPAATQPMFQDAQLGFVTFSSNVQHKRPAVSKGEQTRDIEVDCTSTQTLSTAIAEVCGVVAVTSRFGDVTLCGGVWIGGTSGARTTEESPRYFRLRCTCKPLRCWQQNKLESVGHNVGQLGSAFCYSSTAKHTRYITQPSQSKASRMYAWWSSVDILLSADS